MKKNLCLNNYYRTKFYIVHQAYYIGFNDGKNIRVFSYDIYYQRNAQRDKEYEQFFKEKRKCLDGKRFPTPVFTRSYFDRETA